MVVVPEQLIGGCLLSVPSLFLTVCLFVTSVQSFMFCVCVFYYRVAIKQMKKKWHERIPLKSFSF